MVVNALAEKIHSDPTMGYCQQVFHGVLNTAIGALGVPQSLSGLVMNNAGQVETQLCDL